MARSILLATLASASLLACGKTTPPEPSTATTETAQTATIPPAAPQPPSSAGAVVSTSGATPDKPGDKPGDKADKGTVVKHGGSDPLDGKFTIADATKDLKGSGALLATIDTSKGPITCKLYEDKAPNTAANFAGLARGLRPWKDGDDWVKRPAYDGTTFHRIIKGFMI